MLSKNHDFKVFDFGSLTETSINNCFGCDSCNCDAESGQPCDADWASITVTSPKQEKMSQKFVAMQKAKTDKIKQSINSRSL